MRLLHCLHYKNCVQVNCLYSFCEVSFSWSCLQFCMEYCCHIWACANTCYLNMLVKVQKRICKTVGISFFAYFEHFALRWNVASLLCLFYRYYFSRYSSEWTCFLYAVNLFVLLFLTQFLVVAGQPWLELTLIKKFGSKVES